MQTPNPYQAPNTPTDSDDVEYEYAGFWLRVLASVMDSLLLGLVGLPIMFGLSMVGLYDFDASWNTFDTIWQAITIVFVIFMWVKYAGTPCKRLLKLKVLDADTGEPLTVGRAILRYIGYIPSALVLCLGFIWVGFDKKKQGWHDKMANSVVVKEL